MTDENEKYSKVEREVLQILDDLESREAPKRPSNVVDFRMPKRKFPRPSMPNFTELRYLLSPAKLLVIMLAAVLGAVFLQSVPLLSPILIVVAILALVGVFFARSRPAVGGVSTRPGTKRWRGRDIDLSK